MTGGDNEAAVAAVLDLVAQRCRAISEQDWDALAGLLADELTHTRITGVTQNKPTYLEHVRKNPRWTERPDLRSVSTGMPRSSPGPRSTSSRRTE
jgi:hypothetical protein